MNSFEKKITFVIVSFKSDHIIEKCIKSIKSNIKIILNTINNITCQYTNSYISIPLKTTDLNYIIIN